MTRRQPAAPDVAVDVLVEAGDWPPRGRARGAGRARASAPPSPRSARRLRRSAELSLRLHRRRPYPRASTADFRGKDKPTNVLSFPAPAPPSRPVSARCSATSCLPRETVEREAEAEGLTFDDHLTHLIVHGFLHLLGYDHEDEAEAAVMEGLETAILADLGIADPYADA